MHEELGRGTFRSVGDQSHLAQPCLKIQVVKLGLNTFSEELLHQLGKKLYLDLFLQLNMKPVLSSWLLILASMHINPQALNLEL